LRALPKRRARFVLNPIEMKKYAVLLIILAIPTRNLNGWGFAAHKQINRSAVFLLPGEMFGFYKENIDFLTEHAVDADKRRHGVEGEAPKHYIDLDLWGEAPFDSLPRRWNDAVARFGEDSLMNNGIVPWHVERMYYRLVTAFETRNAQQVLRLSADLGHYIADAHVPLHTTSNYNGQLTGQHGIHALLETRIPELYANDYNLLNNKAEPILRPLLDIWEVVFKSHSLVDCVLVNEMKTRNLIPEHLHFSYETREGRSVKVFSETYVADYHQRLNGIVEKRMREAIYTVASYWMGAWVAAGQPGLTDWQLNRQAQLIDSSSTTNAGNYRVEPD